MLTCRQLIDSVELDRWSRIDFRIHLLRCRSCRAYMVTYRRTIALCRAIATWEPDEDVPEELVRAILSAR
jgi:predicted anti-sigma-YlaC factor YlaD